MSDTANKDLVKNNPALEVGFETDPELDRKIRDQLITARVGLLLKEPFFGVLSARMKLINADKWLPTAATDGRNFYYNTRFMDKQSVQQTQFVFGHEVLHCVYDHIGRRGGRDANLANIAADYCVNGDLIQHNIGKPVTSIDIIHDKKYYGWSFEQVYADLYKNADKIDIEDLVSRLLDDHLEAGSGGDGSGEGEGEDNDGDSDGSGGSGGRPNGKISQAERDALRDEIRGSILDAYNKASGHGAGKLPAGVARLVKEMTDSRIDWRDLLDMQIKSTIKSNFSFSRPSRKGWNIPAIMPGMVADETIDVVIAIDTSGSISQQMLKDFMSEIKGIMDQYTTFSIKLMCFDTEIYNEQNFSADNMGEFEDYELKGFGGTDFEAVYNYMEENCIEPMKLIMFTDGYPCGSWGSEEYCDVCYIIHTEDPDNAPTPEWGTWAYYDTNKEITAQN